MEEKDKRVVDFEQFVFENWGFIKKTVAYYGLSTEEIKQECAVAFFENPEIEKLFLSGEKNKAFTIFQVNLRRNASVHSTSGSAVRSNNDYEKEKRMLDNIFYLNSGSEESFEDESTSMLDIDLLNKRFGKETVDFMLMYYGRGSESASASYCIPNTTARKRASRFLKRFKKWLLKRNGVSFPRDIN